MTNRNMNNRTYTRATERARIVTARKKAAAKKKRIIVSIVAIALVLTAATSALIVGIVNHNKKAVKPVLPTVTTTSAAVNAENNSDDKPIERVAYQAQDEQTNAGNETLAENNAAETEQADNEQADTEKNEEASGDNSYTTPAQDETQAPQDKIEEIDGERVYIDTKRQAPEKSGTPLHFYANGKTSYGFDWNYKTDNSNFVLRCDYNFNQQQYDFQFYGTAPGTAHVTVLYNTDDKTQVPVDMTIVVDDDLNVTQG